MRSMRRRLCRLEAILLPGLKPRVLKDADRRWEELCVDLLSRIDPDYADAIDQEGSAWYKANEEGRTLELSNLCFGFYCTIRDHVLSNTPLEFPAVVAEAYASDLTWGPRNLVACASCRYRFPRWGIGEPFKQCPLCGGGVVETFGDEVLTDDSLLLEALVSMPQSRG
jgi:hypothetical protein